MCARLDSTVPSSGSREPRTTPGCGSSSRAGSPHAEAGGGAGRRSRHRRDRDRGGRGERPRQAARAPAASVPAPAPHAHPHAPLDVVSLGSQRRRVRVRHRRLRRAAGPGAGARSVGRHRRLLARAHRRSLSKRRRRGCRDRDRLRPARHAPAAVGSPTTSRRARAAGCRRDRPELNQRRTLGAGRPRPANVSALVAASGSGGRCGAGGDPRSAGNGLRRVGRASGGHRSVHDDRLPGRLRGVRALRGCSCSDPIPRSRP